jgi:hypothetical protein
MADVVEICNYIIINTIKCSNSCDHRVLLSVYVIPGAEHIAPLKYMFICLLICIIFN